jgi:hypothetical protein
MTKLGGFPDWLNLEIIKHGKKITTWWHVMKKRHNFFV